jgi:hypothetical protein
MLLESHQVIEGIDLRQVAGVDQAREQIADKQPVPGLVKEGVFAIMQTIRCRELIAYKLRDF